MNPTTPLVVLAVAALLAIAFYRYPKVHRYGLALALALALWCLVYLAVWAARRFWPLVK